jgi:hypothetical protein
MRTVIVRSFARRKYDVWLICGTFWGDFLGVPLKFYFAIELHSLTPSVKLHFGGIGAYGSMSDPQSLRYIMRINGLISIIIIIQLVANTPTPCVSLALNERGAMPLSKYSVIPTQWATGRPQKGTI